MVSTAQKRQLLESLRRDISQYESRSMQKTSLSLGDADIDRRMSGGAGLCLGGLHEIVGASYPDMAAVAGFATALGARLLGGGLLDDRSLLWVTQSRGAHDFGGLYGPGLAMLGLDPALLVVVAAKDDREALWVTEEALRTPQLAGVVTELEGTRAYDLKASRRLQLAAERFERPAFLLAGHVGQAASAPSAALTRFRVASAASRANPLTPAAPGLTRFSVMLDRVRGGTSCHLMVEWMHETCRFGVASPISRREGLDAGSIRPERSSKAARAQRETVAALAS